MVDFILTLASALLIAVVTAFLTVRLSLKQFHSQRWWEKQVDAYSSILSNLSVLQSVSQTRWAAEVEGVSFTGPHNKRLGDLHVTAAENVRQAAATGAFYITPNAAAALAKVTAMLMDFNPDYIDALEFESKVAADAIEIIRSEAKRTLQVA